MSRARGGRALAGRGAVRFARPTWPPAAVAVTRFPPRFFVAGEWRAGSISRVTFLPPLLARAAAGAEGSAAISTAHP